MKKDEGNFPRVGLLATKKYRNRSQQNNSIIILVNIIAVWIFHKIINIKCLIKKGFLSFFSGKLLMSLQMLRSSWFISHGMFGILSDSSMEETIYLEQCMFQGRNRGSNYSPPTCVKQAKYLNIRSDRWWLESNIVSLA